MKFRIDALISALLIMLLPSLAQAHRAWIMPLATVLSGDEPWVGFDAAVSNDIFHADYVPLRGSGLTVHGPDGEMVELHNMHVGKQRAVFDINLLQPGTYRIFMASHGLSARWESEDGQRRMWPARGATPDPQAFSTDVPKKARNLQVSESSRRIETFVTAGAPSEEVLQPTGKGLELLPLTHPNDLFSGEQATFRLLIDGKPAAGADVEVVPGGMRYRDDQQAMILQADKNGEVQIVWPQPGMYWFSAEYADGRAAKPATRRSGSYTAVFEVLPQ